jgi:hypothetical protein
MERVLSFGSNCEVGMMINRYYNNNLYSNLFNWTNITLKNLIDVLSNKECFKDFNNIIFIYKIYDGKSILLETSCIQNIKKFIFDNSKNYSIHIDYEFYFNNNYLFWSHGIVKNLNDILNSNENNLLNYKNEVLSKYNHLISKTLEILNNNSDKIKIYIKLLKNEYDLDSIISIHNNIINNKNNIYLGIIYENEEDLNIELKNTILVRAKKLTGHNEAIYDYLYNTQPLYYSLFERLDKL